MKRKYLELLKAWKGFPNWYSRFWDAKVWKEITDEEWTKGVIAPFIVTYIAPALNCSIRLELDDRDFILLKSGDELVYIEHENKIDNAFSELPKLHKSQAPIKCIVSYSELDEIKEYVNLWFSPPIVNLERPKKNNEEWLLIFGIINSETKYMEKPTDWRGICFYFENEKWQKQEI